MISWNGIGIENCSAWNPLTFKCRAPRNRETRETTAKPLIQGHKDTLSDFQTENLFYFQYLK